MAYDMTKMFPDEVLAYIFYHLDPVGKVSASSVCKRWMKVINDSPDLLDDVCIHFRRSNINRGLEVFSTMTRNFCCFYFEKIDIDLNVILFLKKFGPRFRRLSFLDNDVDVDLTDPNHKIANLVNLLELTMQSSDVERMFSYLPKLKFLQLNITNMYYGGDMSRIEEMTPLSLIDFKIKVCYLTFTFRPVDNVYPELEDFIQKRRSSLRSLDLSGIVFEDSNIAKILNIEGLRLERLKLFVFSSLENTLQTFCTIQRWLVALDLENSLVDDQSMEMICNALPQMEELIVYNCGKINQSVSQIFQLKRLWKLDLSFCLGIEKRSYIKALKTLTFKELKVLKLLHGNIDSSIVSRLVPLLPNLRKIIMNERYGLDSRWVECKDCALSETRTFLYRPNV